MIKKIFIIAVLGFLLQGCTDSPLDKARQDYACRNNGGVYTYANNALTQLSCRSGYRPNEEEYRGIIIPEEYYPNVKH